MLNTVYLHIGFHKTGSSAIQKSIHGYDDGITATASFDVENHSIPMFTIFSDSKYTYPIWIKEGCSKQDIIRLSESYELSLRKNLMRTDIENLIISGEDISGLDPHEKVKLISYLQNFTKKIKIIAYVRNPLDFAVSNSQEYIKSARYPIIVGPNFRNKILPFIEVLPREDITIVNYDNLISEKSSVIQDFQNQLNIKKLNESVANKSLGSLSVAILFQLLCLNIDYYSDLEMLKSFQKIYDEVLKLQNTFKDSIDLDKHYFSYFLPEETAADCTWLLENFNINYGSPERKNYADLQEYFRQILDGSRDVLNRIFSEFKVSFDEKSDYKTNFINLILAAYKYEKLVSLR